MGTVTITGGGGGGGGQHTPDSGQLSSMSACPAHEYIILTSWKKAARW